MGKKKWTKNKCFFRGYPANIAALRLKVVPDLNGSVFESVVLFQSKVCGGCKRELSVAMFNKNVRARDGLQGHCKDCNKRYRENMLAQYEGLLEFKVCNKCAIELPISKFGKDSRRSDGVHNTCKKCFNAAIKEYRRQNPEVIQKAKKKYNEKYYEENKTKARQQARQHYEEHRDQILAMAKQGRTGKEGYLRTMIASAKSRAKQKGWEFDLELNDLMMVANNYCPVDGLPFDWDRQLENDSTLPMTIPSLDRIDSFRGYTKDNVMIIGDKWNRWKSNMNLENIELLIKYVRSVTKG